MYDNWLVFPLFSKKKEEEKDKELAKPVSNKFCVVTKESHQKNL